MCDLQRHPLYGRSRFLTVQLAATALGVLCYVLLTSLDLESLAEHKELLFLFNALLLLLLIPFGTDGGHGQPELAGPARFPGEYPACGDL